MNQEVLTVRFLALSSDGSVVAPPSPAQATGVEITFRPRDVGAKTRIVTYWKADLSDGAWKSNASLLRFLDRQGTPLTFLKAASYLMFKRRFSHIKREILGRSTGIVEEASGIPFRDLQRGPWVLHLYGQYKGVISLFGIRDQPALRREMRKRSQGPLPFPYGYDRRGRPSHLIFAERAAVSQRQAE